MIKVKPYTVCEFAHCVRLFFIGTTASHHSRVQLGGVLSWIYPATSIIRALIGALWRTLT
ncbi:hypothetical protein PAAL109150_15825 [Paenibacillus alkaliterrae]